MVIYKGLIALLLNSNSRVYRCQDKFLKLILRVTFSTISFSPNRLYRKGFSRFKILKSRIHVPVFCRFISSDRVDEFPKFSGMILVFGDRVDELRDGDNSIVTTEITRPLTVSLTVALKDSCTGR